MRYELRRRLATLIRVLPRIGLGARARRADGSARAGRGDAAANWPEVSPSVREAVKPGRPRTVEAKAAHVVAFVAPEWARDPSMLPKRPPGAK